MKKEANPGKVISEQSFQFLVWVTGKVEKFPRTHKFTVGDRIHAIVIDIQHGLVEATYTRERAGLLRKVQVDLEKLRFLFRLAAECRLINPDSYQHAARQIDEIGRMTGGWQKERTVLNPESPLATWLGRLRYSDQATCVCAEPWNRTPISLRQRPCRTTSSLSFAHVENWQAIMSSAAGAVSKADEIAPYPEDFSRRIDEAYLDVARRHTRLVGKVRGRGLQKLS